MSQSEISRHDSDYLRECLAAWRALAGERDATALAIERELRERGEMLHLSEG